MFFMLNGIESKNHGRVIARREAGNIGEGALTGRKDDGRITPSPGCARAAGRSPTQPCSCCVTCWALTSGLLRPGPVGAGWGLLPKFMYTLLHPSTHPDSGMFPLGVGRSQGEPWSRHTLIRREQCRPQLVCKDVGHGVQEPRRCTRTQGGPVFPRKPDVPGGTECRGLLESRRGGGGL